MDEKKTLTNRTRLIVHFQPDQNTILAVHMVACEQVWLVYCA